MNSDLATVGVILAFSGLCVGLTIAFDIWVEHRREIKLQRQLDLWRNFDADE